MGGRASEKAHRVGGLEDQEVFTYSRSVALHSIASIYSYSHTEFQFVPLPTTNPVLIGHRWKEYHEALGLRNIVDFSWEMVQKEKSDMIHLLDFPYNGETRAEHILGDGKITKNEHHLCVELTFNSSSSV
jgi:hypothetical protein